MRMQVPFVRWIEKTAGQKGHPHSLNAALAAAHAYDWLVLLEDDWFFVKDEAYIGRAIDIMKQDQSIGQVGCCKFCSRQLAIFVLMSGCRPAGAGCIQPQFFGDRLAAGARHASWRNSYHELCYRLCQPCAP